MSDLGSHLPVVIEPIQETLDMRLKWLEIRKQEAISKIVHLNQAIEDLRKGKIAEIEFALMKAKAELAAVEKSEVLLKTSVETTAL